MWNPFRRRKRALDPEPAIPSAEAIREAVELHLFLRPRVEQAVSERDRLLEENNFTARIRALYQEGRAS